MKDLLTILIPTSPIPSHPSTEIFDETISNVRNYTTAQIIILFDGIHHSLEHRRGQYDGYKKEVLKNISEGKYGDCIPVIFPEHTHQSLMTKIVLTDFVKTPLIMFVEHDTSPINEIPIGKICELVEHSKEINYLRFNIFHAIPGEHQYLMVDKVSVVLNEVPIVRTLQWSQRPHIAKTKWYLNLLNKYFREEEKMMIEDRMHSVVIEANKQFGFDTFGLCIYAPEGNQLRSYTSDGRKDDQKIIEA